MKTLWSLLLSILLLLITCDREGTVLMDDIQVKSIFITLDEEISPQHIKCSEKIKHYDEMGVYDCAFRLAEYEFDIEDRFVLNKDGLVVEFCNYLPEGPVVEKRKETKGLSWEKVVGLEVASFDIQLMENRQQFLMNQDTFQIALIFEEQGLILMQKKS